MHRLVNQYGYEVNTAYDATHSFLERVVPVIVRKDGSPLASAARTLQSADAEVPLVVQVSGARHQQNQVDPVEVESEEEDGGPEASDPYVFAMLANPDLLLRVPKAKKPDPSTGSYPAHCPVLSCRQRFPNKGKVLRHWKGQQHDGDRAGRSVKDTKNLLTADDNCARSDERDTTNCANCVVASMNGCLFDARKKRKFDEDQDEEEDGAPDA